MSPFLLKNHTLRARFALAAAIVLPGAAFAQTYAFSTLAGVESVGSTDGAGNNARFHRPQGIAVDAAGNVYIADSDNNTIRRLAAVGVVATLAGGPGQPGSADGTRATARFNFPSSLVIDAAGFIYVADANNHTIRRMNTNGDVTTFAGSAGIAGSADGVGSAARFHRPEGLAIDGAGNVYVADAGNHTIRKITPGGTVSTLAGQAGSTGAVDGQGSAARFDTPLRVAVNAQGTVYVTEAGARSVRKITPAGEVSPALDYAIANALFNAPVGVAVGPTGAVFVADAGQQFIVRIDGFNNTPVKIAGMPGVSGDADGVNDNARFNHPVALAFDGAGALWVADRDNNTIRKIVFPSLQVATMAGIGLESASASRDGVGAQARFDMPAAVAVDQTDGTAYVADTLSHAIRKVQMNRTVTTLAGALHDPGSTDGAGQAARFNAPTGIAIDRTGILYVADSLNYTIRKVTPSGVVTTVAGSAGVRGQVDGPGSNARFHSLFGLAVDAAGNVYARDAASVRKITPDGQVTTLNLDLGLGENFALAVDQTGNLYLSGDHAVRKITPGGSVTTLAGVPTDVLKAAEGYIYVAKPGSADGIGGNARFDRPQGVAVDLDGSVYVADTYNHTIRRISSTGETATIAGLAGAPGIWEGFPGVSRFIFPSGIAIGRNGELYVTSGNTVQFASQVSPFPRITVQPQSQSVAVGGSVTFSVTTSSSGVVYQWRRNGTILAGATGASMTISSARTADAGDYSVDISNVNGSVTSAPATLTVTSNPGNPPPSPGGGSSSGGGGAPSGWFLAALATLASARWTARRRNG